MKLIILSIFYMLLTGCISATTTIKGTGDISPPTYICIKHNPDVTVTDFVSVTQQALSNRDIGSSVVDDVSDCIYHIEYNASYAGYFQYFDYGEVWIYHNKVKYASVLYQESNDWDLITKYGSVHTKFYYTFDEFIKLIKHNKRGYWHVEE